MLRKDGVGIDPISGFGGALDSFVRWDIVSAARILGFDDRPDIDIGAEGD